MCDRRDGEAMEEYWLSVMFFTYFPPIKSTIAELCIWGEGRKVIFVSRSHKISCGPRGCSYAVETQFPIKYRWTLGTGMVLVSVAQLQGSSGELNIRHCQIVSAGVIPFGRGAKLNLSDSISHPHPIGS